MSEFGGALHFDVADHVATVTINRPERRNAFDNEVLFKMAAAWDRIDGDDDIRVAILTGAGGHFCAGADLKNMSDGGPDDEYKRAMVADPELAWKALQRHYRLKKPLIAAVEGFAVAGGTEILQTTDIRVAGRSAKFGVTEVRWGLFPLGGSTVRLQRQIPLAHAMDLLLTGRTMGAEEAARIGLINQVVDDGGALAAAQEIAQRIAANGPLAVQAVKRSVLAASGLPEADALKIELEIGQPIFATEDAREGPRAFVEKRKADFKGR